jgi:hypothetical protein
MKTTLIAIIFTSLFIGSSFAQTPRKAANAYRNEGYRLIWSDEFSTDGRPDARKWSYEKGFERNHEDQYYQRENCWCEDGMLIFEARKERRVSFEYNPNPTWGTRRLSMPTTHPHQSVLAENSRSHTGGLRYAQRFL